MAIDFTGINNENEFYTHHYLSAIFETDVKDVLTRWQDLEAGDVRPPYARIRTICKNYFIFTSLFNKEKTIETRLSIQREWFRLLFVALGYEYNPQMKTIDAGFTVPVIAEINKNNGAPDLWIIETINRYGEDQDPLSLCFTEEQYGQLELPKDILESSIDTIITKYIFAQAEPPRWIVVINDSQMMLIDRSKWNEKRMLRFDMPEIFGRKEETTLKAMAALLHRESICPDDGISLLDALDENSHKHAFSVSEDLKYALRESIELLGNEAIYYLQQVRRKGVYSGEEKIDPKALTRECLRYMYRLLFILYIEARPELGYVPMKSDAYRMGYSFESLRDLEIIKLTNEDAKNGYYLHESISLLFKLIYEGTQQSQQLELSQEITSHTFRIPPLKTHLFDPVRTEILNKVKFRNSVLQRIIELMSLSRAGGRNSRRGRISYAQLGINQLGAVYEALLSYQGFFAKTELFEVKKVGEAYNELKNAYFVKAEDLDKYEEDEKVYNSDGTLKKHLKGTFIYRLAGRDREKSASYYTPEVLTKCLVKYALKELLKDKMADDILKLTVCEPAMGSAAFLNEAINQLSEAYLDRKQNETGERIAHDDYTYERQKVKMYLADNNVFGVDLNPVAVELAEVSLWLNTISKENFVPWFGMQLVCGNSLIGARRQVFDQKLLKKKDRADKLWLEEVPVRVLPKEKRQSSMIYHFLLPDSGMSDYKDKVIKKLAGENIKKINNWRKKFTNEYSKSEIQILQSLSESIDTLWKKHTRQQQEMRERTTDDFVVWGQSTSQKKCNSSETSWKDKVLEQELFSKKVRNSSPYRRLKFAMDYWCSLWFWPIEKADLLPSRDEYLLDLSLILEGNPVEVISSSNDQFELFSDTMPKQMQMSLVNELGVVDIDKLCEKIERLALVKEIAEKNRFLHWELEFADLFETNGGFDLVLGNPPWIKVEWREGGILGEYEPQFVIKKLTASKMALLREITIERYNLANEYVSEFINQSGCQGYLNANINYDVLKGIQSNLYKCFLPKAWDISSKFGVASYLHPEGVYDDPNGKKLRKQIYSRLLYHFQFQNGMFLFPEVAHREKFSINIYGKIRKEVNFKSIANLFTVSTIEACLLCDIPNYTVEGIKTIYNKWNTIGHPARLIEVNKKLLQLFSLLYEGDEINQDVARLPIIHSKQLLGVLDKVAKYQKKVSLYKDQYFSTEMWHETNAQKDKIILRSTDFALDNLNLILSGPHFYIGNAYYKTARKISKEKADYDCIDLDNVTEQYFPRGNYKVVDAKKYQELIPEIILNKYKLVCRKMLPPPNERTLISAIYAEKVGHTSACFSITFKDEELLLRAAAGFFSLVYDFIIKTTGKTNLTDDLLKSLPLLGQNNFLHVRVMMLSCLTISYSNLWARAFKKEFKQDVWTKKDSRLDSNRFVRLDTDWDEYVPLRTDFERRQALVEIDVIVAILLGLSLDEVQSIYRIQFPVLMQNENDTWYDQKGRIIFTCSKGLSGVGFSRPEWNDIKDMKEGTVDRKIIDDTMPGGPIERTIIYHAPFDRCDREKDYEIAWKEFERRFKEEDSK